MAATIAANVNVRFFDVAGVRRRVVGDYTGPNPYVNPGGDTITAAQLSLGYIEQIDISGVPCDSSGANNRLLNVVYNTDGSVTLRFFTALGTEVANGVDLSAYTLRFEALGK